MAPTSKDIGVFCRDPLVVTEPVGDRTNIKLISRGGTRHVFLRASYRSGFHELQEYQ